jgi:uncharacterized membrane protein YfcA
MISFFTGLALGLVLAVLGAGGGIIAVPVLLLLHRLPLGAAMGSALAVVFAAAAPAALAHGKARRVDLRTALHFGPPSMLGAVLGTKLNALAPERLTYGLFAAVLVLATASLFFPVKSTEGSASRPMLVGAGLGLGVLTGFLGVGGGFLIVPALVRLARLPLHRAVGTSTALIAATSLSGAIAAVVHDPSNALLVLPIAAGAVTGALLGAPLSGRISPAPLRVAFTSLAVVVASVMSWKALG